MAFFRRIFGWDHLVLIEKNPENDFSGKIISALREDTPHKTIVASDIPTNLEDMVSGKYKSISIMIHADTDPKDSNVVTMLGQKLDLGVCRDKYVELFKNSLHTLLQHTDTVYMYTCLLGEYSIIRDICIHVSSCYCECDKKKEIYLSTNVTGSGNREDWNMEWRAHNGVGEYLSDPIDMQHYSKIFKKIPKKVRLGPLISEGQVSLIDKGGKVALIGEGGIFYLVVPNNKFLIGEGGKVYIDTMLIAENKNNMLIGEGGKMLIGEGGKCAFIIGPKGKLIDLKFTSKIFDQNKNPTVAVLKSTRSAFTRIININTTR